MGSAMAIAQHSRDPPSAGIRLPDHREIREAIARPIRDAAEAMRTLLDRTEVLDRVNPEAASDQFAPVLAAGVLASVGQHGIAGPGDAPGVVIELDRLGKEGFVCLQLPRVRASVEGIEHRAVLLLDDGSQRLARAGRVAQRVNRHARHDANDWYADIVHLWDPAIGVHRDARRSSEAAYRGEQHRPGKQA